MFKLKKMKKIIVGGFLLLNVFAFSQNSRFIYEVSMKKDSTNKKEAKSELAYLDTDGKKSTFYAEKRIKRDSVMQVAIQSKGSIRPERSTMESLRSDINYTIDKDYKSHQLEYRDRIARDIYAYQEDRPMDWEISTETAKIGDYKTQKATLNFAGRQWTAWFTQDIPVMDGPYKFWGLPGLIIKIEDSKGDYSFLLKESKKLSSLPNITNFGNIIKVKRKDYLKQISNYQKDPASFMTQGGGGMHFSHGGSGGQNQGDFRKRMEERVKEEAKSNNNPIELN
jgi:GLPGLI family protein